MADTQLKHLTGVVQARLNRAAASSCKSVVLYAPPLRQAATKAPLLFAYRTAEKLSRWGTSSKIGREATVKLLYVLGPTGGDHLEDAAGTLSWAVQMIADALIEARDQNYEAGQKLETLAAIEQITIEAIEYNPDLELPQVEFTIVLRHRWTRTPGDEVTITKFIGDLNLDADKTKPIRRDEYPPA